MGQSSLLLLISPSFGILSDVFRVDCGPDFDRAGHEAFLRTWYRLLFGIINPFSRNNDEMDSFWQKVTGTENLVGSNPTPSECV